MPISSNQLRPVESGLQMILLCRSSLMQVRFIPLGIESADFGKRQPSELPQSNSSRFKVVISKCTGLEEDNSNLKHTTGFSIQLCSSCRK